MFWPYECIRLLIPPSVLTMELYPSLTPTPSFTSKTATPTTPTTATVNRKLISPLSFGTVYDGVYRSSYPATKTLPFVEKLKLKSMVCLHSSDITHELRAFANKNNIKIYEYNIGFNQEPYLVMSESIVNDAITSIIDPHNQPVLVFCTTGKVKTGCVVGCLRKHFDWSIISIIYEYEQYAIDGSNDTIGLADLMFIDNHVYTISSSVNGSSDDTKWCNGDAGSNHVKIK